MKLTTVINSLFAIASALLVYSAYRALYGDNTTIVIDIFVIIAALAVSSAKAFVFHHQTKITISALFFIAAGLIYESAAISTIINNAALNKSREFITANPINITLPQNDTKLLRELAYCKTHAKNCKSIEELKRLKEESEAAQNKAIAEAVKNAVNPENNLMGVFNVVVAPIAHTLSTLFSLSIKNALTLLSLIFAMLLEGSHLAVNIAANNQFVRTKRLFNNSGDEKNLRTYTNLGNLYVQNGKNPQKMETENTQTVEGNELINILAGRGVIDKLRNEFNSGLTIREQHIRFKRVVPTLLVNDTQALVKYFKENPK